MSVTERSQSQWPGRIAWWLVLVLVAVFSWQAGRLAWTVYEGPSATPRGSMANASGRKASRTVNYGAWQLFGASKQPEKPAPAAVETAPETRLRLDLYGVVVADVEEDSGAIIAERGKGANYFKVDAMLPGNARLAGVYSDKVLLDRGGVMETLSFDDREKKPVGIQSVARPAVNTAEQFAELAENRLKADAVGALQSVGLEPASSSGQAEGYVFNGNNPMLSSLNLQKGDVIRSVNGHVLGNPEQDRAMIQQFYQSGVLEVEVERDGAIFSISYPLP